MRIWTLMENTACSPEFCAEHGLSLYIGTKAAKILFDAGQSAAFAVNAEKLGLDLSEIDFAVLSHGHYDHGGGLNAFLEKNAHAPVYVSRYAFGEHFNAGGKYIGLDPQLRNNSRILPVDGMQELAAGITLLTMTQPPEDTFGMYRLEESGQHPEDFRHEQYLLIEEEGKRILISGCSHKGIRSIVRNFSCDVLIGGFHFMKMDPQGEELHRAARELLEHKTTYYTGHCTGQLQFDSMKQIMGDRLFSLSAGSVLEL